MTDTTRSVQDLIDQAALGDGPARQDLLEVHRESIRRMVAARLDRRLTSRIDPSDVVQDTLADASKRLDDFLRARPLPFLGWLRQIAGERVVDAPRRHLISRRRSVTREDQLAEDPDDSTRALAR